MNFNLNLSLNTDNSIIYNNYKDVFIKHIPQFEMHKKVSSRFKFYECFDNSYSVNNTMYLKCKTNLNADELKYFINKNTNLNLIKLREYKI